MRWAVVLGVLACAPCASQAVDDDSAALALADHLDTTTSRVRDWQGDLEAAAVEATQNDTRRAVHGERLSGDFRYDSEVTAGVRGIVSNRLDVNWLAGSSTTEVNTLREAYLSWRPLAQELIDVGRINIRSGVAFGYNPTDFWRSDAVRQIDSLDPDSLRANRLGSVMLRGQALWATGSATVLASPRLADAPSNDAFSLDIGATNRRNRWSLAVSQRLASNLTPQVLLYSDGQGAVQAGLNVTFLVNAATIAYVEWSGGRSASLLSQALGIAAPQVFASRLASGFTYTTPFRMSVTIEYEANTAALDGSQWNSLRYGAAPDFYRYLEFSADQQALPTRHAVFTYAQVADLGWRHFDAAAFSRLDLEDHSRLDWLEARYHWPTLDLALQVQRESGSTQTAFGASPQRRVLQLLLAYYFP